MSLPAAVATMCISLPETFPNHMDLEGRPFAEDGLQCARQVSPKQMILPRYSA